MSHPGLFLPCDLCQERRSTEPRVSSPEARTGSRACGLRVRATKVMGSLGEVPPAGARSPASTQVEDRVGVRAQETPDSEARPVRSELH